MLIKRKGKSKSIRFFSSLILFMPEASPIPKNTFEIFDPITLLRTIGVRSFSGLDLRTDTILVASSGRLVPRATIVAPIINEGILSILPNLSEGSIKISEDLIKKLRDIKNITKGESFKINSFILKY
ncbi:MAG: hypothetical protein N4A36_02275 [Candidatus Gracilibacteria bacterium]|nr:hypothetical protein [Candidatus Gracilibacteria bacterium]